MTKASYRDTGTDQSRHLRYKSIRSKMMWAGVILVLVKAWVQGQETSERVRRTPEEVEALIKQVGSSAPDWWDSVELRYPDTLDLEWPLKPVGKWNNQRNVGQYIWDIINPNPNRWKEGIRLVNHLMVKHQDDRAKLARAMQSLGTMFHNFIQDWPRAVFWWRMSARYGGSIDPTRLANCYWQMGCASMSQDILQQIGADYTRNGEVIKLWADMGQLDRALQLAERKARSGMPHIAYLAAGNACRQAGRHAEAEAFYRKTMAAPLPAKENNDFTRAVQQARENLETMRLFQMLDLTQIPDGVYHGNSTAFNGPLHVAVSVANKRITSVKVVQHREKQFYSALSQTPLQIVEAQAVQGIDAVTGATITSEAIITAAAQALASATP